MTGVLFFGMPYLLRGLLSTGMTRRLYALIASLSLGIIFFLLTVMFVEEDTRSWYGIIFIILALLGGYPTNYLSYPALKKLVQRNRDSA